MFPTVFSTLLEGWYFAVDFEGWGHTNDKDFFSWGMSWYAPKLVSTHLVPHTHEHLNHFDGWSVGTERTIKDSFFSGCVAFHHLNALMTFVIDRGIVEICFSTYIFFGEKFSIALIIYGKLFQYCSCCLSWINKAKIGIVSKHIFTGR